MPRRLRVSTGGIAYHVLNRAVGRGTIFHDENDYSAFIRIIDRTAKLLPMRIVSFCLMPNHWHLVLWPTKDGQLSDFMRLLTVTHTQRWHAHHQSAGTGPVYQGRFKSFPIQQDEHFQIVCRYVERNARRAKLATRAERWPWCSLAMRNAPQPPSWLLPMKQWPVEVAGDWTARVNEPQTARELEEVRTCVKRGRPYGDDGWTSRAAKKLGLQSTLRPRGRQRVKPDKDSRPV